MVQHKEFVNAGKKPGLQVWRIENLDLKPVPKELHGNFYIGDAYLVLHTTAAPSYSIHMWMGDESSQDERGALAIFATQLDDFLGGSPVQFLEMQNNESMTFLSYFTPGIKYQKGGVKSGFHHVVTNEVSMKRLLHVKGRRIIRAMEVDMSWNSFNHGDCFIIDLGKNIYEWCGGECNMFEKVQASKIALGIRDEERNGRAKVYIVQDGEEPDEIIQVLGPKPSLKPCETDDKESDKTHKAKAALYMISDASGSMKTSLVAAENPFKQAMLSQDECYILDNGENKQVFVWKGSNANVDERKAAFLAAQQFIKDKKYSNMTQIQVIPACAETTMFKQFFCDWVDKYDTTCPTQPYVMGRIAKVKQVPFDASKLHRDPAMAAQYHMVDDGNGEVKIWRVENGDKVPVDAVSYGQFYGGDCYLILYSYQQEGRKKHIIYFWQGLKCTKDELAASAFLTVQLDREMDGSPVQVRVTQGQEPPHLMSLFKNKPMIIHGGGTSRKGGQTETGTTRLFHIRQSSSGACRAVEVEPVGNNLNTNDVFALKCPSNQYVWRGEGASDEEMNFAKRVIAKLGWTAIDVNEGKEPADFWKALGGKKDYQTSKALKNVIKAPRLFGCSNKTGTLIVEEVPGEFTQSDLATDDVMILDTWNELFIWIGNDANEAEKDGAVRIAKEYVDTDPSGRSNVPTFIMKQGAEPLNFIGWFHGWDPNMWNKDPLQQLQKCH
ncbi:scinderin like b [Thalassophryne amazonica]|uniref:scinderin like b n=1 Tax=Thalassophryne amazonica TaxID=390379 RepID=UPI001471964B|nr:scinderin like b [Thalassophryne amazonica]